tara:strand:+ start:1108 stop:1230 length:123 start_codon:yes stop_codon:yes gene_type:complete
MGALPPPSRAGRTPPEYFRKEEKKERLFFSFPKYSRQRRL